MRKAALLLVFILFIAKCAFAQNEVPLHLELLPEPYARFQQFTLLKNNPIGRVNDMLQDRTGYIWFGGQKGIARFDGFETKVYTSVSHDGLADDYINDLALDINGMLLIGTSKGLSTYNESLDEFELLLGGSNNGKTNSDSLHIRALLPEGDTTIWLSMLDGTLGKYNRAMRNFTPIAQHGPVTQPYYPYHALFKDYEGDIFLGGRGRGPMLFNHSDSTLTTLKRAEDLSGGGKRDYDLSFVFQDGNGPLWMGGFDGLYIYNKDSSNFFRYLHGSVYDMIKDRKGNYWVGSGFGALHFDWKSNSIWHYQVSNDDPEAIGGERIYKLFEDRVGRIWFSHENGVSVYLPAKEGVQYYFRIPGYESSPSSSRITAIESADNNNMWVATSDAGLNLFNLKNKEFTRYTTTNTDELIVDNIKCLLADTYGNLYIGFWSGRGFSRFDTRNNKFYNFRYNKTGLTEDWYNDLEFDQEGNLYLGFWGGPGLTVFDVETNEFARYLKDCFADPYNSRLITSLFRDSNNRLWVGTTQSGIHYYKADSNYCKSYYDQLNPEGGFAAASVNHIVEDYRGVIWVASNGLYQYDEANDRFQKVKFPHPNEGLLVYKMLAQGEALWLLTERGLMRYQTEKGWLTDYSMIVETRFRGNQSAAHKLDDGRFIIGGENGLAVIDPNILGFEHVFPRVFLTYMDFSDGTALNGLSNIKEIRLGYKENFFAIHFGTDAWQQNSAYQFYYKLENFDDKWVKLQQGQRTANFTNVPAGNYIFRLRTGDQFGNLSTQEAELKLIIDLPWYKTWWFIATVSLLTILVIVYLWWLHLRDIKLSMQNVALSHTLLRLQMNPHFIFNSLTAIQNYIYAHQPQEAGQFLSDFSKLIRLILDNSRHEYISLEKEIETMTLFVDLQKLRFEQGFDFICEVDPDMLPDITFVPPMLAQPFLENAIEHGLMPQKKKGIIHVRYTLIGKVIRFEIRDNGIGLTKSKENKTQSQMLHHSLSIKICRERLFHLHKDIKSKPQFIIEEIVEDGQVKGTRVMFDMPFRFMPTKAQ
jgi:ligand-binding sensor domain-containing protein